MNKWLCLAIIGLMVTEAGAATTNTWKGSGVNWSGPNWDVAPAVWTDYSANLIFGSSQFTNGYTPNNNISGAALGSITFTSGATQSYSVTGNQLQFGAAADNGGNVIVNNSGYAVTINPTVLFNFQASGDRYVKAVSGDINFKGVQLWTSPQLSFVANAGRSINFLSGSTLTAGGGVSKIPTFQGDGTGGSFNINSAVAGILDVNVKNAGTLILNMSAGQVGNITVQSGKISFSKDNLSFGSLIFDQTSNNIQNEIAFNGNDNTFTTLSISATATNQNILDFGAGTNMIVFSDCSSQAWLNELIVTNFEQGVDSLRFGIDSNGLTVDQLSKIKFSGYNGAVATLDSNGFIVIPEPTTISLFVISGIGVFLFRRRLRY